MVSHHLSKKTMDLLMPVIWSLQSHKSEDLFIAVYEATKVYFLCDHIFLAVYDQEDDKISFPFFRMCGKTMHDPVFNFSAQPFLLGEIIFQKKIIIENDPVRQETYLSPCPASFLGVPVVSGEDSMAALVVGRFFDDAKGFDADGRDFLWVLSSLLGSALALEEIKEHLATAEKVNRLVFRISEAVTVSKSLNELYASIHELLNTAMDVPNFYIAMYDPEKQEINFPYFRDEYDALNSIRLEDVGKKGSLTATVIFENTSYLYTREMLEKKSKENAIIGKIPAVWAGVPLVVTGKVIGAMVIQHYTDSRYFSMKDVELLEMVSGQIALAIERKKNTDMLLSREEKIQTMSRQTEEFSAVAASILSLDDEHKLFDHIGRAIVEHSDYSSLIISYFKDTPPYRDIIAFAGYDPAVIDNMRTQDRPARVYLELFEAARPLGRFTYYISHKKSHAYLVGNAAYSDQYVRSDDEDAWHPEDFLFVKMSDGQGNFIGVISVDNPKSGKKPTDESIRPLEVFSALISQIIVFRKIQNELNHHKQNLEFLVEERTKELRQEIIERKKAEQEKEKLIESRKEMEIAKNIQTSLLPDLDVFKGVHFEISANMTPAEDVGGDYYDLILGPDQRLWFGIGDVTGHGLVSGLIMMMAQVSINTLIRAIPGLSPEDVLIYANQVIHANVRGGLKVDHHMTISFLVEEKEGVYRYAGAHEIILIFRKKTRQIEKIGTRGMWLGIIPDISKPTKKYAGNFCLEKGDILFLYTDGVIEICNKERQQFDIQRLSDFLCFNADEPVEQIKHNLLCELNRFKYVQTDDITFMIMRKT